MLILLYVILYGSTVYVQYMIQLYTWDSTVTSLDIYTLYNHMKHQFYICTVINNLKENTLN